MTIALKCPNCGSEEGFTIETVVWAGLSCDGGTPEYEFDRDDLEQPGFLPDGDIHCLTCEHDGRRAEFGFPIA